MSMAREPQQRPERMMQTLALGALLSISCRSPRSNSASLPPKTSAPNATTSQSSAIDAVKAPDAAEFDETAFLRIAAEMRESLITDDRARFAHALIYPVTVNTDSGCRVLIANPSQFATHLDQIVTPKVRRAIFDALGASTFGGPDLGFGNGDVWLVKSEPRTVFNSGIWEVPGEPCDNWDLEPAPAWLSNTWVFAAVAPSQSSTSGFAPSRWEAASLRIDLKAGNVELALTAKDAMRCRPLWFGHEKNQPLTRRLGPSFYGYTRNDGPFFDVECSVEGTHGRVQRLHIKDETSLVAVGDDGFFVFLRPADSVRDALPGSKGESCGTGAPRCRRGLLCQFNVVEGERCEPTPPPMRGPGGRYAR